MCGLVGLISSYKNGFSYGEAGMFRDMLYIDALRGWDATGIMYADKWNNIQVHKAAIPSPDFLGTSEWKASEKDLVAEGIWAFGHNRAATRGEKTDKNSHPFIVDDKIILMQNGTYKGSHKHHKDTDVDTEACAHVIAESATVSEALKKIDAAYAFIWYNVAEKTINIIRNHERPLWVGYLKDGGCAYASEEGILLAAAQRNNMEFRLDPFLLKESGLITIDFSKSQDGVENFEVIDTTYVPRHTYTAADEEITSYWWEEWERKKGRSRYPTKTYASNGPSYDRQTYREGATKVLSKHLLERTSEELNVLRDQLKGKTFTCEALEYAKVFPDDNHSTEFYIYGTIISQDPEFNDIPVCWTVDATHGEREIINYISSNFFSCSVDYLVQWLSPVLPAARYHFAVVMNEVKMMPMLTNKETHEPQTHH